MQRSPSLSRNVSHWNASWRVGPVFHQLVLSRIFLEAYTLWARGKRFRREKIAYPISNIVDEGPGSGMAAATLTRKAGAVPDELTKFHDVPPVGSWTQTVWMD